VCSIAYLLKESDAAGSAAASSNTLSEGYSGAGAACLIKFVSRDCKTIFAAAEKTWWVFSEVPTCSKNALRTEVTKPQEAEALNAYSRDK
jgi:hypothetical protein